MAKSTKQIITQFGNQLVKDLQKAVPSATGKTADSIYIEFTKTGFVIRGAAYIENIIEGRGPTAPGAKKGDPTVQQQILEWIRARSITPRDANMTDVSLSWAISNSIHKKGYKGKGDIFENVLTKQRIASLTKTIIKSESLAIQSNISKAIKK